MTADEKIGLKKSYLSRSKRAADTVNLLGQYVLSVGADPTSNLVDSQTKGQLILKCPFGVFKSTKSIFLRVNFCHSS
jgi:hypothetical protein